MIKKTKTKSPLPEQVTELKGNWGKGKQAIGELFCFEKTNLFVLKKKHQNQILALRGTLSRGFWYKSKSLGVKGIICGQLPDKKFSQEIEKEIFQIENKEKEVSFPLVVFGINNEVDDKTWRVLESSQGKKIVIEGNQRRVLIPK